MKTRNKLKLLLIMLCLSLITPNVSKAAATYEMGTFIIGVEDVGTSSGSDLDNNDVVMSVKYLAEYNNSCTLGDCLVNLVLMTTPLAAGATHSLGVRIFPYGNSSSQQYDYVFHGTSGGTLTTNHFYETRLYEGISDMFTCGASTFVNTFAGSASCQGKTRIFSFYFEDNTLAIDATNIDNSIADLIHVENYTLCQGIDSNANSSENALIYSIYGSTGGVPVEYSDFYTAYTLSGDTSGAGQVQASGFGKCDALNNEWDSTCPGLIGTYMGSLGSLPSTVVELDNSGVFRHPTWEIATFDGSDGVDTFVVGTNWVENKIANPSTYPKELSSAAAVEEFFTTADSVGGTFHTWKQIQAQRSYSQIVDPTLNSNQHSGGGGAVPTGASCGSPP